MKKLILIVLLLFLYRNAYPICNRECAIRCKNKKLGACMSDKEKFVKYDKNGLAIHKLVCNCENGSV